MLRKNIILILILSVGIFTMWGFASAQVRDGDITLSINPEYPSPNQNVNAALNSYSTDLNKANITWLINNETMNSGIGKKSFSFTMENLGISTVLSATIETIDGQNLQKTLTITSSDVDMLWEAYDSYSPPFYKGKTLVPSQGSFKVVAVPNLMSQNEKVNINNLSYAWTKDDNNQVDSSGWGKNYFIFRNSYLDKTNTIKVKVSNISGNANTSGKITLQTVNPKILFYKNDPLFGIKWEEAISDGYTVDQNGETFVVEPYFFSPKNINSSNLTFDWSINGEKIQTPDPKNILSIKPDAGQTGSAVIKLLINNTKTLFQSMSKQIQISF